LPRPRARRVGGRAGRLGQGWLEDGAPLLPIISQNYGLWQTIYVLALIVIFLLWAAAMRQKIGLLHNSKQGLAMQYRIDEQNARREERARAIRERREQLREERAEHTIYHKAGGRSTKFDY
jgi:hypothetical protein